MRFFKELGKKTVLQGMSAWALYQIFYWLNSFTADESDNDTNKIVEKVIVNYGIPVLATLGFEDINNRITGEAYNVKSSVINLVGTYVTSILASVTSPHMPTDMVVPLSLMAFGIYYFYFLTDEELLPAQHEESLHGATPRRH